MVFKIQTVFRGLALVTVLVLVLIVVITASPSGFVSLPVFYNDTPSLPRGFYHAEKADTLVVGDVLPPHCWRRVCSMPLCWHSKRSMRPRGLAS